MVTIVTHVEISKGQEPAWDAAIRERVAAVPESEQSSWSRRSHSER
jgi:hypothetical protein